MFQVVCAHTTSIAMENLRPEYQLTIRQNGRWPTGVSAVNSIFRLLHTLVCWLTNLVLLKFSVLSPILSFLSSASSPLPPQLAAPPAHFPSILIIPPTLGLRPKWTVCSDKQGADEEWGCAKGFFLFFISPSL